MRFASVRHSDWLCNMPDNPEPSGDHFSRGPDETWAVVSDVPERQGVTGHNVRFVLLGGLVGAVLGLTVVFLIYFY
jgi:hypothetical protein